VDSALTGKARCDRMGRCSRKKEHARIST
jgi:hypothetical protein